MTASAASPILKFLAPPALALAAATAAANWYLEPAKVARWATVLIVTAGIALVLWLVPRGVRKAAAASGWTPSLKNGVDSIRSAVVFASLMMMAGLVPNLVGSLGLWNPSWLDDVDKRGAMVLTGLFIVMTGNAIPKTLTPLSVARCGGDVVRAQAFQRFFGWTWVLMGLAFSTAWLTVPVDLAGPLSVTIVLTGILIVTTVLVRLMRTRRPDRTNSPARP